MDTEERPNSSMTEQPTTISKYHASSSRAVEAFDDGPQTSGEEHVETMEAMREQAHASSRAQEAKIEASKKNGDMPSEVAFGKCEVLSSRIFLSVVLC